MENYIKALRQYVAANPAKFDDDCDHPALDALYWHYGESHSMANDKTRSACHALNECLKGLSLRENDQVFTLVGAL